MLTGRRAADARSSVPDADGLVDRIGVPGSGIRHPAEPEWLASRRQVVRELGPGVEGERGAERSRRGQPHRYGDRIGRAEAHHAPLVPGRPVHEEDVRDRRRRGVHRSEARGVRDPCFVRARVDPRDAVPVPVEHAVVPLVIGRREGAHPRIPRIHAQRVEATAFRTSTVLDSTKQPPPRETTRGEPTASFAVIVSTDAEHDAAPFPLVVEAVRRVPAGLVPFELGLSESHGDASAVGRPVGADGWMLNAVKDSARKHQIQYWSPLSLVAGLVDVQDRFVSEPVDEFVIGGIERRADLSN